jgi:inner membrane protein COX18
MFRSKRLTPPPNHISNLFLQLPPTYRSFHASLRPQFLQAGLEIGVTSAHTILEGLHSYTGLPWAYTLPLAALAIRTTFILPLSVYSRRMAQKQVALSPILQSWQHVIKKETMREVGHLGPVVAHEKLMWKIREKRSEIYKRWGCPLWKNFLPLIQLPIWLTVIETVRAMCGTGMGLLGSIIWSDKAGAATWVAKEMSFATEGALWFSNLMAPDPQLLLPFMLSGAIFLNLWGTTGPNQAAWQRRLSNSLKIVALAIGPLTLHVPSAMLVYWISSSLLAWVQARVLDVVMPIKKQVEPCNPKKRLGLSESKAKTLKS